MPKILTSFLVSAKLQIKIAIFECFMENMHKYTVAGHSFGISLPEGMSAQHLLRPYEPFVADSATPTLFTLRLELVDSLKAVAPAKVLQCLNDEAPYFWIFEEEDGSYSFGFSYTKAHPDCVLKVASCESVVYVAKGPADRLAEFAISNAVMLLYTFFTAPYDTMMVHASVIAHGGLGYMFLGKSGTGKSTHSRLWLNHIDDTELLNDDNPVVRVHGSEAVVYGTPWSGKTPCYKNMQVPLKAVVRLSQAPYNKIARLAPLQSFASLMPACSCKRWDGEAMSQLHKAVEKTISIVPCYHLECLPDEAAAVLCHSTVSK